MVTGKDVRQGTGCLLMGLAYPVLGILGLIIHIWAIVIAFSSGGIIAAGLTLALPVLAEIYWGFVIWNATGTFQNLYCLAIAGYAIAFIIGMVGVFMLDSEV